MRKLVVAIVILPILHVSSRILGDLKTEVGNAFLSKVEIAEPLMSLADNTYDKARGQYDASRLIPYLESKTKKISADKILAVGNMDMFVHDLNFVFGVAQRGGRLCAVSLYRLDQRFYSKESDYEKLSGRAAKEAIHELGHCYGLDHCKDKKCVMAFSNDVVSVDEKSRFFCDSCKEKLRKTL